MAKIYETKEDFTKDALDAQAKDLRLQGSHQAGTGSSLIGTSFFVDLLSARGTIRGGLVRTAGSLLGIGGMIQIVRSFFTENKAHDLELQRDRMGPTHVVLPPEVAVTKEEEVKDCGCKLKNLAASGPLSLIDRAASSDSTPSRG